MNRKIFTVVVVGLVILISGVQAATKQSNAEAISSAVGSVEDMGSFNCPGAEDPITDYNDCGSCSNLKACGNCVRALYPGGNPPAGTIPSICNPKVQKMGGGTQ
jgi:hypothetical protein